MVVLTKELLNSVRDIDGFPKGEDEDIIALSDPPYYTPCPNPFIEDFIKEHGKPYDPETDDYHREPYAFDVSEGKNGPIYNAHSYHTKVPYKAIMKYILHYTEPNDIVLDSFAGTGMTSIAAQLCGTLSKKEKTLLDNEEYPPNLGVRKSIINDLSPGATLISSLYNSEYDKDEFITDANNILNKIEKEIGWMYRTYHIKENKIQYIKNIKDEKEIIEGEINHIVWSDVFSCPDCLFEFNYWDMAVDIENNVRREEYHCPKCQSRITKKKSIKLFETHYDESLNQIINTAKLIPVIINYTVLTGPQKGKRFEKKPDKNDFNVINKISNLKIPYWYPIKKMPEGYNTKQPKRSHGLAYTHQFYTRRNLWALSLFYHLIRNHQNRRLLFWFTSTLPWCGKENRLHLGNYFGKKGGVITSLRGTWYIASLSVETNVIRRFRLRRKSSQYDAKLSKNNLIVSTQSATNLRQIPANTLDYVFTDPPFGANLMYSELNYILESWFNVTTNNRKEAIINKVQKKTIFNYQQLMEESFRENYRVLKPNRWMTVVFHNSKNSVWMSIQEALNKAGFVVADVRTLDKQRGSFKQVTTTSAVKQDLIISCYKPPQDILKKIIDKENNFTAWDFTRQHLKHLPKYVENDGIVEIINERQNYLLFDRMVAFFVQRGIAVPMSASEFYVGLKERFPERDDMYFLHDQVAVYDSSRMKAKSLEQSYLTVHDEKSTIQWLRRILEKNPQTYQEIQPEFLQNLYKYKHEDMPELREILDQNFVQGTNGKWHVPDPTRDKDLEQIRNRALVNEFQEYKKEKGKIRSFRSEAVRVGFSDAWQKGDYDSIIIVAEKLPTEVLYGDPTLLMYYDNALARQG